MISIIQRPRAIYLIGASGIAGDGIYDTSLEDTEIKQLLVARSNKNVSLVDGSKFGGRFVIKNCGLPALDMLIADRPPTGKFAAQLKAACGEFPVAGEDRTIGGTA